MNPVLANFDMTDEYLLPGETSAGVFMAAPPIDSLQQSQSSDAAVLGAFVFFGLCIGMLAGLRQHIRKTPVNRPLRADVDR